MSSKLQQMLLSLASPYHLQILTKLLLVVLPADQLRVIRILDGLHRNKLPQELFNAAAKPILIQLKDEKQPKLFLEDRLENDFSKLLYILAARIRLCKSTFTIERTNQSYLVCSRLLLRLMLSFEQDKSKVKSALKSSLDNLKEVCEEEQGLIFDILGSSIPVYL